MYMVLEWVGVEASNASNVYICDDLLGVMWLGSSEIHQQTLKTIFRLVTPMNDGAVHFGGATS